MYTAAALANALQQSRGLMHDLMQIYQDMIDEIIHQVMDWCKVKNYRAICENYNQRDFPVRSYKFNTCPLLEIYNKETNIKLFSLQIIVSFEMVSATTLFIRLEEIDQGYYKVDDRRIDIVEYRDCNSETHGDLDGDIMKAIVMQLNNLELHRILKGGANG